MSSAIRHQLPETRIIGCFFHFKQALKRKLKKHAPKIAARGKFLNMFNFLTIIPINEIKRGVEYI
jgi:hypothetical protein